jgi:hypothetical protein
MGFTSKKDRKLGSAGIFWILFSPTSTHSFSTQESMKRFSAITDACRNGFLLLSIIPLRATPFGCMRFWTVGVTHPGSEST